jgi:hypothetical protein
LDALEARAFLALVAAFKLFSLLDAFKTASSTASLNFVIRIW